MEALVNLGDGARVHLSCGREWEVRGRAAESTLLQLDPRNRHEAHELGSALGAGEASMPKSTSIQPSLFSAATLCNMISRDVLRLRIVANTRNTSYDPANKEVKQS